MHKSKLKGVTLAVLLAFAPIAAEAAGLGRLTVTSGLGEPLSAEIELLSTTPDELASLTAGIAPQEAYNVQGVERTAIHNAIKVDVSKRADGTPILKLTSNQAVSDPFLDMLIQVDWSTGRLLREYTVLLDPPGYSNQAQVYNGVQLPPATESRVSQASPSSSVQTPAAQQVPAPVASKPAPVKTAPASAPTPQLSHTTVSGDTLSAIANQHQVQGVSLDQMLVGLYRANEDAFSGNNMNRLKVGQILRVPSASELQQITSAQATREVRVQAADWNAYRNRLADLAADSLPSTDGGTQQSASGRISSAATDQATPPATGPRDVVKLSRSDASANDTAQQLNAMQEELTAKDKGLKEAAERTAMLEKQIADMQKLLTIKNQALANLQNGTDEASATAAENEPVPVLPEEDEIQSESAEPAAQEQITDGREGQNDPVAAGDAAEPVKPEQQAVAPADQVSAEEPSLFDDLVGDDPLPLALAGGGIALLLGGWLYMRNRRKRELDSFEKGILTAGGLKANTVFGNTSGATVNTGDTSFLNDFSQNTGGMIDTHDVDPIAEAEVYMAYGRDAQAEEILKDAIVKEPQRHELHLKLLEIYAARNDTSAFETVAGEIYTTLGAADPIWSKVAVMGRKLEPENPLYSEDNEIKPVVGKSDAPNDEQVASFDVSAPLSNQDDARASGDAALAGAAAIAATSVFINEDESKPAIEEQDSFNTELDSQPSVDGNEFPALDFDLDVSSSATVDEEVSTTDIDQHTGNHVEFTLDELPEPPAKSSLQLDIAELDAAIPDFDLPALTDNQPVDPELEDIPEFSIPALDEVDQSTIDSPLETPEVDLGLPEITLPEIVLTSPAEQSASDESLNPEKEDVLSDIDFDLPEISFTEDVVDPVALQDEDKIPIGLDVLVEPGDPELKAPVSAALNDGVPHFDFGNIDLGESDQPAPDVTTEEEEISFPDIDLEIHEESTASQVADLDLSNINLDIDDVQASEDSVGDDGLAEESADVDTKLDLVTAYMDMGDNEGARELLEEILKEGGPRQKQKAQSILDNLP